MTESGEEEPRLKKTRLGDPEPRPRVASLEEFKAALRRAVGGASGASKWFALSFVSQKGFSPRRPGLRPIFTNCTV